MAKALKEIGFDALSVANNHSFDHGRDIFEETIAHLTEVGIKVCGQRGKDGYFCKPVIVEKTSITIAILAYNWIGLDRPEVNQFRAHLSVVEDGVVNYSLKRDPTKNRASRLSVTDKNKPVMSDIRRLRDKVDFLILMPHWGYEWTIYPPYGLILEARSFVEAGADLIIGSHPHVPQGVERYKNGLIIYSLGNFLFDSHTDRFNYGMILDAKISKNLPITYELHFVRRNERFQPEPVSRIEAKENMSIIELSSNAIKSAHAEKLLDDEMIFQEFVKQYKALRYRKIIFIITKLPRNRFLLKHIVKNIITLLHVILLNITGRRVRW
jgi:poly-gamma-glutamate synthesis protein (capsule biosynthesis protein)